MDVTQEVDRRLAHGCAAAGGFYGHVWRNGGALTSDTHHRPQDLRVERRPGSADGASGAPDAGHCDGKTYIINLGRAPRAHRL